VLITLLGLLLGGDQIAVKKILIRLLIPGRRVPPISCPAGQAEETQG